MPEIHRPMTNFLALKGLAIVRRNAPQKLVLLQSMFEELSAGLSQQQTEDLALMTTGQRQQEAMESGGGGSLRRGNSTRGTREGTWSLGSALAKISV